MLPTIIRFSRTRGAPVSSLLQQRVLERIAECHRDYGKDMALPTVSFDLRGKTAGQAFPGQHHIRLNGQLLNENPEHFIEQTVGHEWAHLLCHFRFGPKVAAHGKEWKSIMLAMGLPPERCHVYDTTKSAIQRRRGTRKKSAVRVVHVVTPPGILASATLWEYAQKIATRSRRTLPSELRMNKDWLVRWIDWAKRSSK